MLMVKCVFLPRYTYEVSPVFTLMENAVLKKLIQTFGWEEGGDGLFNAGISLHWQSAHYQILNSERVFVALSISLLFFFFLSH